ncbi:hypothetical protein QQ045_014695 [Rhodiola kirilowii]
MLDSGYEKKSWAELVWEDLSSLKHNFCMWLAVQNKLPTLDKIRSIRILDKRCCWCNQDWETKAHFFFRCSEMRVLNSLLNNIGMQGQWTSWDELLHWRVTHKWRSKEEKAVASFIINAAVYF